MKFLIWFLLPILVAISANAGPETSAPTLNGEDIVIIVNGENSVSQISENELRDYYFKRKRQWPDGTPVRFLDRTQETAIRKAFLKNFVKKTSEDVDLYWIGQKLYSGDSAPLKESSDSMTVQFVASFKGAIGYVPTSVSLTGKNVKAVKVE